MTCRILGVDPGSLTTGWGLIDGAGTQPTVIDSGILNFPRGLAFPARLARLQREFQRIVSDLRPDAAAVESPFQGVNARSALQLAHARGVILAVLAGQLDEVVEYTPATVKKALTGNGRADKQQVAAMVQRVLGLPEQKQSADLTDALSVAWCHATTRSFRGAVARAENGARSRR